MRFTFLRHLNDKTSDSIRRTCSRLLTVAKAKTANSTHRNSSSNHPCEVAAVLPNDRCFVYSKWWPCTEIQFKSRSNAAQKSHPFTLTLYFHMDEHHSDTTRVKIPRLFRRDRNGCVPRYLHFKQTTLLSLMKMANLSESFLPSLLSSHRRKITKLLIDG